MNRQAFALMFPPKKKDTTFYKKKDTTFYKKKDTIFYKKKDTIFNENMNTELQIVKNMLGTC